MLTKFNAVQVYEKERVEEILHNFERCMDSLVGMPNNERTLKHAQMFVNTHVEEMKSIGYRMKDRMLPPSVGMYGSLITCVPIEFEKEEFPVVVVGVL